MKQKILNVSGKLTILSSTAGTIQIGELLGSDLKEVTDNLTSFEATGITVRPDNVGLLNETETS